MKSIVVFFAIILASLTAKSQVYIYYPMYYPIYYYYYPTQYPISSDTLNTYRLSFNINSMTQDFSNITINSYSLEAKFDLLFNDNDGIDFLCIYGFGTENNNSYSQSAVGIGYTKKLSDHFTFAVGYKFGYQWLITEIYEKRSVSYGGYTKYYYAHDFNEETAIINNFYVSGTLMLNDNFGVNGSIDISKHLNFSVGVTFEFNNKKK